MAVSLIQAFEQTIEPAYALKKSGNMFEIVETAKSSTNNLLKIGGCKGFGFSLDKSGRHPWQFIVNGPLEGVVSVCDGIIIFRYKSKNYIIVLDLKSKKAGAKAFKQVSSGVYLCEWLCNLLKLNNHLTESFEFIGVVCKTRGAVAKKTSRKGLNAEVDKSKNVPLIILSNPGTIHIRELIALI
ncbi:hypothetical protein QPB17_003502 [Vibrio cholerae]|nr:hypothetical protein [Vibrio cholerae]ELP4888560.1 hypothetical protein [Vibrio cholerae]ELT8461897.1 hypothetical protein [Vibrio cholerae]